MTAALLTYKVAKSSEATAERSVQIAKDMRDMEVLNEGPKLHVREIRNTGKDTYIISMINAGNSTAINIDLTNIKLGLVDSIENPLSIIPSAAGSAHFKYETEIVDSNVFVLNYESVVGNKYSTEFSVTNRKEHQDGDFYYVKHMGIKIVK